MPAADQSVSVEGERRHVTVLFADLVGFTAFSERSGQEAAFGVMQEITTLLRDALEEHGGTVKNFTGDGIMALFGVPIALDIQPQADLDRLRCALEDCDIFKGAGPRAYPFWAHMTIAEFISVADTKKLVREIGGDHAPRGSFVCDHIFSSRTG
jgi:hypothetical protein